MNENKAQERLAEIAALLAERERHTKTVQAIDDRIAELAGLEPKNAPPRKTGKRMSAADFTKGCGI